MQVLKKINILEKSKKFEKKFSKTNICSFKSHLVLTSLSNFEIRIDVSNWINVRIVSNTYMEIRESLITKIALISTFKDNFGSDG